MATTVLLTGVTGFIAKHIARHLLRRGYFVVGTLRDATRTNDVRAAIADVPDLDRLKFVSLDLLADNGWSDAMQGIDSVIHCASPFPMKMPTDDSALLRPAVEGTERVLQAAQAAGVSRVVITSSMVAMMFAKRTTNHAVAPEDWTDLAFPGLNAYARSKTLAERCAWDWADRYPNLELTTINPGLVLGAPLGRQFGTSLQLIDRLVQGSDFALPELCLPLVDVVDVAMLHVMALETPGSIGRRFVAAERTITLPALAQYLKEKLPETKIPTRRAPKVLLRALAFFDPAIRSILWQVGHRFDIDNEATRRCFDFEFRSGLEAAVDSARFLTRQ